MSNSFINSRLSYNVLDVLEPTKVPVDPHRDVGILIDIDNQDVTDDLKLSGSDLDNIKKSEFDLVDLFQNIYVTPQHIKQNDELIALSQVGFSEFNNKERNSSSSSTVNKHVNNSHDIADEGTSLSNPSTASSRDKGFGSLETAYPKLILNVDIKRELKVPSIKDLNCEFDLAKHNKLDPGRLQDCKKTGTLFTSTNNTGIRDGIKTLNGVCNIDGLFNNKTLLEKQPIGLNTIPTENRTNLIKNHLKDTEIKLTVTLDKKVYAKQLRIRSDIDKIGYTKAPNLCEKSVVLPQIIKRLEERRKVLSNTGKFKRKLVLDSSNLGAFECQDNIENGMIKGNITKVLNQDKIKDTYDNNKNSLHSSNIQLNPTIALENCNRERLIANRVHSAFQKYVLTGSYY